MINLILITVIVLAALICVVSLLMRYRTYTMNKYEKTTNPKFVEPKLAEVPRANSVNANQQRTNHFTEIEPNGRLSPFLGDPTLANLGFGNIEPIKPTKFNPKLKAERELVTDKKSVKAINRPNYISVYVMAKKGQNFSGYELLQSLLAANLRYGAMSIFHRHENPKGSGRVLFSVASATEPGTFDLRRTGQITCAGLCLFMNLKETNTALVDFEILYNTAVLLAEDLDGELRDSQRELFNAEILASYKEEIRELSIPIDLQDVKG